jgi:alkanesulfonate monooxygenase SsuD/methylene tetrahydromethanopterin reductase-like flavin-dependent oxidoreductase (luciferase family)
MFMQDEYEGYNGTYWSLPPRKILPKPYKKPHPPMWYAAGNTSSWEMAAHYGLGILGFSVQAIQGTEVVVNAYKSKIGSAEPIGAFVNDNVMVTSTAMVAEDSAEADRRFMNADVMYLQSNVFRYHDTFPHPPEIPNWPDLLPDPTPEMLPFLKDGGIILGDPDEALQQCQRWESTGIDQLVFGTGMATREQDLETIRLIGQHVIPKLDKDPEFRSSKFRDAAAAKLEK